MFILAEIFCCLDVRAQASPRLVDMPGKDSFFKALLQGELPTESGERFSSPLAYFALSVTENRATSPKVGG